MEVIPNSYIARVVLAYLYEEKLNKAAIEFCMTSPYLKEERDFVKRGFRPATCISLKLTALFREYGEIQQKLDYFVEKYGAEIDIQLDLPLVRKIDLVLSLIKQLRHRARRLSGEDKGAPKRDLKKVGSCKRKRIAPSPHPSYSSSTPEVGEPKAKRICTNPAFIVLNDSGKNLSNISHISAIREEESTQDSEREDEAYEEIPETIQEEEEPLDVRKFPSIDLFSQTLLENDNYPEKIADLINKELESSMNNPPDAKEGTSAPKEDVPPKVNTVESDPKNDCQSFNFNFDELISNIVNNAVKDPVFDNMMEDISSKAVHTQNDNEIAESEDTPAPETPLKDRLRKTCRKNYNSLNAKRPVKKVRVISDEPYYGGIPEGVDVEQSQSAAITVVKVESSAVTSADLESSIVKTNNQIDNMVVQPEIASRSDHSVTTAAAAAASTTQFYVIQPDNTTKLVDINQLQFPTQQSTGLANTAPADTTLIPITGVGIPENTYYINVPSCYMDPNTQLPVYFNTFSSAVAEQPVNNSNDYILPDTLPSPDKFLIFPSSSATTSSVSSSLCTSSVTTTTAMSSQSSTSVSSVYSKLVPLISKPEVKSTPENCPIQNIRSNSTPSRKASHIRILNFHTPPKQFPLSTCSSSHIPTPVSAPPSVSARTSRIPLVDLTQLDTIGETSLKEEPKKTPEKLNGTSNDKDSALPSFPIENPNSVSNTPRVSKDPRTCVRVLSHSADEESHEKTKPAAETVTSVVTEIRKKAPKHQITEAELEAWRKIRAVSKSNFDQHLRMVEEQKQKPVIRSQCRKKQRQQPKRRSSAATKESTKQKEILEVNDSLESLDEANSSLTEIHGQMLEDALASAKKSETGKTPAKTPAKPKAPSKGDVNEAGEQGNKIYVKIGTPRKKTPLKASPKRRPSRGEKSAKKPRPSSPKKKLALKRENKKPDDLVQQTSTDKIEDRELQVKETDVKVESKPSPASETAEQESNLHDENQPKPDPEIPEKESEPIVESNPTPDQQVAEEKSDEPVEPKGSPETPAKTNDSGISQVEITPIEVLKPIKDHPKLLAKKSSAEYVRKEQEKAAEAICPASAHESPPEKPTATVDEHSPTVLQDTPFKADISSIPNTPRFLMPNQIENTPLVKFIREGIDTNSSHKKTCEIQTPNYPITPGLVSTPKSVHSVSPQSLGGTGGFSSRRTDYSSGSSYYKPDESEDMDKNIEAMLHSEKKKRLATALSDKERNEELAQPKVENIIESTPQKEDVKTAKDSVSSSDTSSSSDSSSDSSTSVSSPENSPVKEEAAPIAPSPKKPHLTAFELRRQQQAELEAKKQRTIARMKISQPAPMLKKIERKISAPPGFKARTVVINRNKEYASKPAVSQNIPIRKTASASSKRKNPTPRKVVFLDNILPTSAKKLSPKRKPSSSHELARKSPRSSLAISEQEVHRILTPRKDQVIEGTYESENLSRLCCTPEVPDIEPVDDRKQANAAQNPEPSSKGQETPDSNKENLSLEAVKDTPTLKESKEEEDISASSDDDEDDAYNDCSFNSFHEECFFRFVYSEKKTTAAPSQISPEVRLIKKCKIVLEERTVFLEPVDSILLFEQCPSPPPSSGTRSSTKKTKSSISVKDSKPKEPPPEPAPAPPPVPTSTIKAKINVIPAVRHSTPMERMAHLAAVRKKQQLVTSSDKREKHLDPKEQFRKVVLQPEGCNQSGEDKLASPSPKMPLKLDMKKKQQQQQQQLPNQLTPSKSKRGDTQSSPVSVPPQLTTVDRGQSKEDVPANEPLPKLIKEDDIYAILTHIHGS